jgi:L-asparaginase
MGKTSLANKFINDSQGRDERLAGYVDVTRLKKAETLEEWVTGFERQVQDAFEICIESSSSTDVFQRLIDLFEGTVRSKGGISVLFVDEIDYLRSREFGQDLIETLKAITNIRFHPRYQDTLGRFCCCTIGLRGLWDLVPGESVGASEFGSEIHVEDFPLNDRTLNDIASGFSLPTEESVELARKVLEVTDGHPRLTMKLCRQLTLEDTQDGATLEHIVLDYVRQQKTETHGMIRQIEGFIFRDKSRRDEAIRTYRGILAQDRAFTELSKRGAAALLKRCGLVKVRNGRLDVKNRIFQDVCDEQWANTLALEFAKDRVVSLELPKDRKTVVLINTGGTLGMVEKPDGNVAAETFDQWKSLFRELDSYAHVEAISAFEPIDSANVFQYHWTLLAHQIKELQAREEIQSVIIVHGTDTMAYTACALALALGSTLRLPIVLTGSQAPPNSFHGDARNNLYRALLVATSNTPINEVVICFDRFVYRGCRAQKKDDRDFAGFHSPSCPELAHVTAEEANVFTSRLLDTTQLPRLGNTQLPSPGFCPEFSRRVQTIRQSPGMDPDDYMPWIKSSRRVEGIVFETLGAGNVPSQAPFEFITFMRIATEAGIPVIITSRYAVHPSTHTRYVPGVAPIEAGAIPVGDMTSEAAETKLQWVLAQLPAEELSATERIKRVQDMMHTNYIGEINEVVYDRQRKAEI